MDRGQVILKDSTMREGLDVPGVSLDVPQRRALLEKLAAANIPEAEVVAPGHFERDLDALRQIARPQLPIHYSGLVYGNGPDWQTQIITARGILNRLDILIPLSERRAPSERHAKMALSRSVLDFAGNHFDNVGIGFPHATQVDPEFVQDICRESLNSGANRITLYDTNGSALPWEVTDLVRLLRENTEMELCFHAHNDLGLAAANSVSAVRAGADCLDVTVNGLGDRAGNASLEQVALLLHKMGCRHHIRLDRLCDLSRTVEKMTGIPVAKLAPVVGEFVFCHKSPSHLQTPGLFEPFDPALIGTDRSLTRK